VSIGGSWIGFANERKNFFH